MPKGPDTPNSIRIRENQKRSRARRKDLIESLQKRVKEYELQGIKATQEMQVAARKVVRENARLGEENARLRALLEVKGVGREDVERWLRGEGCEVVGVPASDAAVSESWEDGRGRESLVAGNVSGRVSGCVGQKSVVDEVNQSCGEFGARTVTMENSALVPPFRHREIAPMRFDGVGTAHERLHVLAPQPAPVETGSFSPGLETSCEAATRIIIGMNGDRDMEFVRSSLGCKGRDACSVKNSTVLQIMSDM